MLGEQPAVILRWFGRSAMPLLAQRYDDFFKHHVTARTFVLSINDIIHPEVRKLYPGAVCPHFNFGRNDGDKLLLGYRSVRHMCHLAHGFAEGAADHFGETIEVAHLSCMIDGAPSCQLEIGWLP